MHADHPLRPERPERRAAPADDLAWAAFRYVADAMPPAEAAAFEQTLNDDQSARVALAAAVDRFGALAVVCREVAATPPVVVPIPTRRRFTQRASLGMLATAAVVWLVGWWGNTIQPALKPVDQAVEVALAWSSLRQGLGPPDGTLPFLPDLGGGVGDLTPLDPAPTEVAELPAEPSLSSWMMAAVASEPDPANPAAEDN